MFLPIPVGLKLLLDALPLPRNAAQDGRCCFWNGVTSRRAVVGIAERTPMAVFQKSGVKDAHAHRYRHTLAARLWELAKNNQDGIDKTHDDRHRNRAGYNQNSTKVTKSQGRKLMKLRTLKWCGEGDLNAPRDYPADT